MAETSTTTSNIQTNASLIVDKNLTVGGTIAITGAQSNTGAIVGLSTASVNGAAAFGTTVSVTGTLTSAQLVLTNTASLNGNVTIGGSDTVTGSITANGNVLVAASKYIRLGTHVYILSGSASTPANVTAAATAVDASHAGSMYLSTAGKIFMFTADATATTIAIT